MVVEHESVWDYPRPPAVRRSTEAVEIRFGGEVLARSQLSMRVLETSHPPTYYLPVDAFRDGALRPVAGSTVCEFKGRADYFDVVVGDHVARRAAWHYAHPRPGFESLVGHVAVMPALMDECLVDDQGVNPQDGDFYGGWITPRVKGPFKGAPGTLGW